MEFHHIPVLLNECITNLNIISDGIYVDGTLGGAGHASQICKHLNSNGVFIGIDQDICAIEASKNLLKEYEPKIILNHNNFSEFKFVLNNLNITGVNGILLDLGVSSYQLDEPKRGFSYMQDAPLDMRMNSENDFSAYTVVNEYSKSELENVIFKYGEERWARRIAEFIVQARKTKPIYTTFELVEIIKKAIPKDLRRNGHHPAKKTFQAIRIEVNGELKILKKAIEEMTDLLLPNGRLCIITFHSLEDRIVKDTFRAMENPCTCPHDFPICICGNQSKGKVITRKPIIPSDDEIEQNHRSRSAKLRVFEKFK